MIANVNEQLWIDYDLDIAVFLDYIAHWLHLNSCNKQPRNFHNGRYWTYNTLEALHSIFPGWSKETIRNIIRKCVKKGLIIVSNFNKKKYDRTNWYTLSDLSLKYYPKLSHLIHEIPDNPGGVSCGDFTAPCGDFTAAIPKTLTSSSNNTITTSESNDSHSNSSSHEVESDYSSNHGEGSEESYQCAECAGLNAKSDYHNNQVKKESSLSNNEQNSSEYSIQSRRKANQNEKGRVIQLMWEMISVYRQVFPNNPQPHLRLISTSLQKTLQTLIKRWHELDPNGNPFEIDAFTRYMNALKSLAPKFSLGEYETQSGNKKKNSMETFCRWNTIVKFLENQYS